MKSITIYTTPNCPYCHKAKELLTSLGLKYTEIDALEHPEEREKASEKYHWQTVPMIIIGDEFIGGYDDLAKLHAEGKLQNL